MQSQMRPMGSSPAAGTQARLQLTASSRVADSFAVRTHRGGLGEAGRCCPATGASMYGLRPARRVVVGLGCGEAEVAAVVDQPRAG